MSAAGVTSTFCTGSPLMCSARIFAAISFASAGVFASLTPPALPRPPACTCALTTTVPPNCLAIASTSSGVAGDFARRNRNAFLPQNLFCLILVNVHALSAVAVMVVPASPWTASLTAAQRRDDCSSRRCGERSPPPHESSAPCCLRRTPSVRPSAPLRRPSAARADAAAAFPSRRRRRRRRSGSATARRRGRAPSTAAARSLSTTASIPSHPSVGCSIDGRAAAAACDDQHPLLDERLDHRQLANAHAAPDFRRHAAAFRGRPSSRRALPPRSCRARSRDNPRPMNFVGLRSAGSRGRLRPA